MSDITLERVLDYHGNPVQSHVSIPHVEVGTLQPIARSSRAQWCAFGGKVWRPMSIGANAWLVDPSVILSVAEGTLPHSLRAGADEDLSNWVARIHDNLLVESGSLWYATRLPHWRITHAGPSHPVCLTLTQDERDLGLSDWALSEYEPALAHATAMADLEDVMLRTGTNVELLDPAFGIETNTTRARRAHEQLAAMATDLSNYLATRLVVDPPSCVEVQRRADGLNHLANQHRDWVRVQAAIGGAR